jgi:hypothetical protein
VSGDYKWKPLELVDFLIWHRPHSGETLFNIFQQISKYFYICAWFECPHLRFFFSWNIDNTFVERWLQMKTSRVGWLSYLAQATFWRNDFQHLPTNIKMYLHMCMIRVPPLRFFSWNIYNTFLCVSGDHNLKPLELVLRREGYAEDGKERHRRSNQTQSEGRSQT